MQSQLTGKEICLTSEQIPSAAELNVLVFVSGKLTVFSTVLGSLVAVPDTLVKDCGRGAAIDTVLHLPERVEKDSSSGIVGTANLCS